MATMPPEGGAPAYGYPAQVPYGSAPYGPGPEGLAPRNGMGTTALVLGIIALVTCWTVIGGIVLGGVAIGLGIAGRRRAKRGEATNRGSATAGIVSGALGLVLAVVLIAAGVALLNTPAGKTLRACLKSANGDKTQISQCQAQYANNH